MAKKGWGKPFEDPILLPDGRELITLKDDARRMGRRDRNRLPTIGHGVLLQAMGGRSRRIRLAGLIAGKPSTTCPTRPRESLVLLDRDEPRMVDPGGRHHQ
jgi:hypothetical protein